jgi:predicted neutral ceramidase superfamily lipid hydrolase
MDTLEPLFGKVTPSSISGDLLISIILIIGLSFYIYKKGVKNIFIISIALYIAQVLSTIYPWKISKVAGLPGEAVLFIVMTILVNWAIQISALGSSLAIAKKPLWRNMLFGVSVVGLLLVNILSVIKTQDKSILNIIEQSLFSKESFQIFWTVLPLLFFPFLKAPVKKSSSKSK